MIYSTIKFSFAFIAFCIVGHFTLASPLITSILNFVGLVLIILCLTWHITVYLQRKTCGDKMSPDGKCVLVTGKYYLSLVAICRKCTKAITSYHQVATRVSDMISLFGSMNTGSPFLRDVL